MLYASTFPHLQLIQATISSHLLLQKPLNQPACFCSDHSYIQQSKGSLKKKTQIRANHVTLPLKPIASDPVLDLYALKDLASVCLLEFIFFYSLCLYITSSVCSGHTKLIPGKLVTASGYWVLLSLGLE